MKMHRIVVVATVVALFTLTAQAVDWEGDWGFTYVTVGIVLDARARRVVYFQIENQLAMLQNKENSKRGTL